MNEILTAPVHQRWPRGGFFKRLLWKTAGSCALGGLYAWRPEHNWFRVERHRMALPNLGEAFVGAKVALISDLHCSPIVLERYLRHCVEAVNAQEPDFVAITGDFITGPKHYARRVARVLRDLTPRIATVACLGNHDYGTFHPTGLGSTRDLADYLTTELAHADVFVMNNETRIFHLGGSAIQFVGVEDYWSPRFDPALAFESAREGLPTIGLVHNPDAALSIARYGAHWVLAGHTHGSSIEPKIIDRFMPAENRHFHAGQYDLGEGKSLYVTRGIGYGRRVNLNGRPEITLFTLERSQAAQA